MKKELLREIKVIAPKETDLPEGIILIFDSETNSYMNTWEEVEVSDGCEVTDIYIIKFSKAFVDDNMGILFVSIDTDIPVESEDETPEETEYKLRDELDSMWDSIKFMQEKLDFLISEY